MPNPEIHRADPEKTTPPPGPPPAKKSPVWPFLLVLVLGFAAIVVWMKRVAPVPAVFEHGVTLAAAMETSKAEAKPVVAVLTADWCPPCQQYKRTTLANAEVAKRLEAETIPVYVDVDKDEASAGRLAELAKQAGFEIRGIPTTVVIADGRIVAHQSGALSKEDLFALIEQGS